MPFIDHLKSRVKPIQKRIVLPENNSDRALKAAAIVAREGFAKIILVGDPEQLNRDAKRLGVSFEGIEIINPATYERMDELCAYFAKRREKKGMTVDKAREIMTKDTTFFGAGLVAMGDADGCVSGSTRTSADVIKAGLQVIGVRPGNKTVCSGFIVLSNTNLGEAVNWSSVTAVLSLTRQLNSLLILLRAAPSVPVIPWVSKMSALPS
mgnify:CR=1 FL=1